MTLLDELQRRLAVIEDEVPWFISHADEAIGMPWAQEAHDRLVEMQTLAAGYRRTIENIEMENA